MLDGNISEQLLLYGKITAQTLDAYDSMLRQCFKTHFSPLPKRVIFVLLCCLEMSSKLKVYMACAQTQNTNLKVFKLNSMLRLCTGKGMGRCVILCAYLMYIEACVPPWMGGLWVAENSCESAFKAIFFAFNLLEMTTHIFNRISD